MTTPAVAIAPAPTSVAVVPSTVAPGVALSMRVRSGFAAMRAGVANVGKSTIDFLHIGGFTDWLRRGWNWFGDRLPWARDLVQIMGTGATTVAALTSETGQGIVGWLFNKAAGVLKWGARVAYGAVDWTLRLFGRPGNNAADWMFDRAVSVQNWISEAAAPQFHRVVRSTSFDHPNVKAVHKVSLGVIAWRLIQAFVVPFPLKVAAGIGAALLIAGKEGREVGKERMEQASMAARNPLTTARAKVDRIRDLDKSMELSRAEREELLRYMTKPELAAMKAEERMRFAFEDAIKLREEIAAEEGKGVADELSVDAENPEASPRPVRILTD